MPQPVAGLYHGIQCPLQVAHPLAVAGREVAVDPDPRARVLHRDPPELDVPALAPRVPGSSRVRRPPTWLGEVIIDGQRAVPQGRHRRIQIEHMPAPSLRIVGLHGRMTKDVIDLGHSGQQPARCRAQQVRLDRVQRPGQGRRRRKPTTAGQRGQLHHVWVDDIPERADALAGPRRQEQQQGQPYVQPAVAALPTDEHPIPDGRQDPALPEVHQQRGSLRQPIGDARLVRGLVGDCDATTCHADLPLWGGRGLTCRRKLWSPRPHLPPGSIPSGGLLSAWSTRKSSDIDYIFFVISCGSMDPE